jgi:FAD/FMN-containing dehydrogenase
VLRPVGDEQHRAATARLLEDLAALPPDAPVRLGKRTSNLFRQRTTDSTRLDVSDLNHVIDLDPVARTARVQGMTTYEDLVATTLPHALMPLVVPQLRTITLGGAVTGLGIESSSFRSGLPHESVLEAEILTGDGEIVVARPDGEHADLFRTFPNSGMR